LDPTLPLTFTSNLPDFTSWVEDWADGKPVPSLNTLIPDKVEVEIEATSSRVVTQQSFLESWLFSRHEKLYMVNPSIGSIWRAYEAGASTSIIATNPDRKWEQLLLSTFVGPFEKKNLVFETVKLEDIDPNILCYIGSNGININIESFCLVALEPNPYSVDLRAEGLHLKAVAGGYEMVYERKKMKRVYVFKKQSDYYRIDPNTLQRTTKTRGDSFFVSTNFDPKILGLRVATKHPNVLGDLVALDILPPYEDFNGFQVSRDSKFVYDVQCMATVQSRRRLCAMVARTLKLQVFPLTGLGKYVANPYATEFTYLGAVMEGSHHVITSMSLTSHIIKQDSDIELHVLSYPAVQFRVSDFGGKAFTPFEKYGSVYDIATYVDISGKIRKVDLRGANREDVSFIFSSFNSMIESVSLLAHFLLGSIPSAIEIPFDENPTPLQFIETEEIDVERGVMSGDAYNKSTRQQLLDWYQADKRRKSSQTIYRRFGDVLQSEIDQIMRSIPTLMPFVLAPQDLRWGMDEDVFLGEKDPESSGLASFEQASALKAELFTMLNFTFVDKIDADVRKHLRIMILLGYQIVMEQELHRYIKRDFRYWPAARLWDACEPDWHS